MIEGIVLLTLGDCLAQPIVRFTGHRIERDDQIRFKKLDHFIETIDSSFKYQHVSERTKLNCNGLESKLKQRFTAGQPNYTPAFLGVKFASERHSLDV